MLFPSDHSAQTGHIYRAGGPGIADVEVQKLASSTEPVESSSLVTDYGRGDVAKLASGALKMLILFILSGGYFGQSSLRSTFRLAAARHGLTSSREL